MYVCIVVQEQNKNQNSKFYLIIIIVIIRLFYQKFSFSLQNLFLNKVEGPLFQQNAT